MAWIRMGVFVALTLVATTLPAGSQPALVTNPPDVSRSATDSAEASPEVPALPGSVPAESAPASDQAPQEQPRPRDSGLLLAAAPQLDVWKSAPARPLGHSGPQPLAALHSDVPAIWKPSPSSGQDLQLHASRVHEHAHEWLTCRYPNAPPALA